MNRQLYLFFEILIFEILVGENEKLYILGTYVRLQNIQYNSYFSIIQFYHESSNNNGIQMIQLLLSLFLTKLRTTLYREKINTS